MGGDLQLLLSRVHEANDELRGIRRESDPSAALFEPLEALRDHVTTVAEVLGGENGFDCRCETPHRAFVRVKECFALKDDQRFAQLRDQVCSLAVQNANVGTDSRSRWTWADLRAEAVDDGDGGARPPDTSERSPAPSGGSSLLRLKSSMRPTKDESGPERGRSATLSKTLRFPFARFKKDSPPAVGVDVEPADGPRPPLVSSPATGLCAFIEAGLGAEHEAAAPGGEPPAASPHMTLSRRDSTLRLRLTCGQEDATASWAGPLSVQEQFAHVEGSALSTEQRLQLAYRVGSCLFYLHSTPWMPEVWTSNDVYLPRRGDGQMVMEPLFANMTTGRPASHSRGSGQAPRPRSPPPDATPTTLRSPAVSCLGRFLVELCYGASWDQIQKVFIPDVEVSFAAEADSAVVSSLLSWAEDPTVAVWDKPCHQEGYSYFDAIKNCFFGELPLGQDPDAAAMSHHELRKRVYMDVLRPLQFALEDFQAHQTRIFGPTVDLWAEEGLAPGGRSRGGNELRLFDDEDVKGDSGRKYAPGLFSPPPLTVTLTGCRRPEQRMPMHGSSSMPKCAPSRTE